MISSVGMIGLSGLLASVASACTGWTPTYSWLFSACTNTTSTPQLGQMTRAYNNNCWTIVSWYQSMHLRCTHSRLRSSYCSVRQSAKSRIKLKCRACGTDILTWYAVQLSPTCWAFTFSAACSACRSCIVTNLSYWLTSSIYDYAPVREVQGCINCASGWLLQINM